MNSKIRIGITGYGNLGRGVEYSINQNPDMELVAIFTRRPPDTVVPLSSQVKVLHISEAADYINDIDVMMLCGGSATDLPEQGPLFAGMFNTVDSFDTHAKIPEYLKAVNEASKSGGKTSVISVGWDPGLFSINRMIAEAILPKGNSHTFWGRGVSQGHSDALRRINGVKKAIQYTIPADDAINTARTKSNPELGIKDMHLRDCYVVLDEGANSKRIEEEIKTMPNYFADYKTEVTFISEEKFNKNHRDMPHGGFVIRNGKTGDDNKSSQIYEFSLKLDSNPEFTASVMTAYARAAFKLNKLGQTGAKTVFDIPIAYLSHKPIDELIQDLL